MTYFCSRPEIDLGTVEGIDRTYRVSVHFELTTGKWQIAVFQNELIAELKKDLDVLHLDAFSKIGKYNNILIYFVYRHEAEYFYNNFDSIIMKIKMSS